MIELGNNFDWINTCTSLHDNDFPPIVMGYLNYTAWHVHSSMILGGPKVQHQGIKQIKPLNNTLPSSCNCSETFYLNLHI